MYTLYTIPGSCSTGIHVLLKVLGQAFQVIQKKDVENFEAINPLGSVPVLDDNGTIICEGAAIVLYLLEKHQSEMLPTDLVEKGHFIQKLMFNYATIHPAYGRLFFAMSRLQGSAQAEAYAAASTAVSELWQVVDAQLASSRFVSGDQVSIIDYLLCIYANWGSFFDNVEISLGPNVQRMVKEVYELPEVKSTFEDEGIEHLVLKAL